MPEVTSAGPFFDVRTDTAGADDDHCDLGYLSLADVYATGSAWAGHIGTVAGRLGTGERRVAASIAFQGLAARLWSVGLGSAALTGRIPAIAPERLYWNPGRAAPADLRLPGPAAPHLAGDGDGLAVRLRDAVMGGHLLPLERLTREVAPVSAALLRGNAASALAGSLGVLTGWCRSAGRPDAAGRAVAVVRTILADPLLRGTGTLAGDPDRGGRLLFRRRTCCLYYRVPGGGLCGDCVFDRPPGSG